MRDYFNYAESQGHFAPTKNLRIQLEIERNLKGGSTLVPLINVRRDFSSEKIKNPTLLLLIDDKAGGP